MKRLLLIGAALLGGFGLLRLRCALRGRHNGVRHFLGGFRCVDCGKPGADLEEMGLLDGSAYVPPMRRGAVRYGTERSVR